MKAFGIEMEDKTALIIGGVVLVIGYWALSEAEKKIAGIANTIGEGLDPTSSKNIFYRGTNEIGSVLTGDDNFSLGVWMYDVLHPNEAAGKNVINQPTSGATGSW